MDLELTGKRAIVTGGSRGIGLAVARALATEGCDVALVARDAGALAAAREAVAAASGRTVIAVSCDTGDDDSVREMAAAVADGLGRADILVNAAARPNPNDEGCGMDDNKWSAALPSRRDLLRAASLDNELYFDSVSQIQMSSWHRGRVVLVGDAAHCASPLSGRGTSLAMTGAWLLAEALRDHPDNVAAAFDQYEREQRPHVSYAQGTAGPGGDLLVPATQQEIDYIQR